MAWFCFKQKYFCFLADFWAKKQKKKQKKISAFFEQAERRFFPCFLLDFCSFFAFLLENLLFGNSAPESRLESSVLRLLADFQSAFSRNISARAEKLLLGADEKSASRFRVEKADFLREKADFEQIWKNAGKCSSSEVIGLRPDKSPGTFLGSQMGHFWPFIEETCRDESKRTHPWGDNMADGWAFSRFSSLLIKIC